MFGLRPAFVVGEEQEVTVPPGEDWSIHSHTTLPPHLTPSNDYFVARSVEVCKKIGAIETTLVEFANLISSSSQQRISTLHGLVDLQKWCAAVPTRKT